MEHLVERILAACCDTASEAMWLDGGPEGRGYFAHQPDAVVYGSGLEDLRMVDDVFGGRRGGICMGHVTYDAGVAWLLGRTARPAHVPPVLVRHYPAWLEVERDRVVDVRGDGAAGRALEAGLARTEPHEARGFPLEPMRPVLPEEVHRARVRRALDAIARGETYQVNLAQPFFAPWSRTVAEDGLGQAAADLYVHVRRRSPATFGAFYGAFDVFVVSNAPETLLVVEQDGERVVARSRPIKGTRPRGRTAADDRRRGQELLGSTKDLAEHVMIVDLVRNDLGRVARPGTVVAPSRPSLVTLPTVHHLESEVAAALDRGTPPSRVFAALFPGGSVTGAPKRRTVEIIDALEDRARGVYCGAIFVATRGRFAASIPIRTGLAHPQGLELLAGGGIVADSDPEAERVETEVKTRAFCIDGHGDDVADPR